MKANGRIGLESVHSLTDGLRFGLTEWLITGVGRAAFPRREGTFHLEIRALEVGRKVSVDINALIGYVWAFSSFILCYRGTYGTHIRSSTSECTLVFQRVQIELVGIDIGHGKEDQVQTVNVLGGL